MENAQVAAGHKLRAFEARYGPEVSFAEFCRDRKRSVRPVAAATNPSPGFLEVRTFPLGAGQLADQIAKRGACDLVGVKFLEETMAGTIERYPICPDRTARRMERVPTRASGYRLEGKDYVRRPKDADEKLTLERTAVRIVRIDGGDVVAEDVVHFQYDVTTSRHVNGPGCPDPVDQMIDLIRAAFPPGK